MDIVITVKINRLANHMLASMNYITKTNLLQHLKIMQRSKALASIQVFTKLITDCGTARLQKNQHLPFNTNGSAHKINVTQDTIH